MSAALPMICPGIPALCCRLVSFDSPGSVSGSLFSVSYIFVA